MVATILMLEQDDLEIEVLRFLLERDEHEVLATRDPDAVFDMLVSTGVDLVIIEPALHSHDGDRVCRQLRQLDPHIPMMIVSERHGEDHVVRGLGFADDYLRKPILPREFLARVAAVLRRSRPVRSPEWADQNLAIGEIELKLNHMQAAVNGTPIRLTRREFALLYALMDNCNRVLTRDQLIEQAWGHEFPGITKTVDVCILRLRKKLRPYLREDGYIQTTRGFGYTFAIPPKMLPSNSNGLDVRREGLHVSAAR
jgi:two-component system alkaline phosphatase synthesis response regulator PhoP